MSQSNTSSPKDGTLFTLTSDDFSSAIGAALKAAETHSGKPAGKKQVALNAAAKTLSGPRANWGALKAKDQIITNAARSRVPQISTRAHIELDETRYEELPEQVAFDEFGLIRFDLEGEAQLRRIFAPLFSKGVSVVSLPIRTERWGHWALWDLPVFLDRRFETFKEISTHERRLAWIAFEYLQKFEVDQKFSHFMSRQQSLTNRTFTMNITEVGTIFIGLPWICAFESTFSEVRDGDLYGGKDFKSTYANIRSFLGPSPATLKFDWQFEEFISGRGTLPVFWFVDPEVTKGLPDTEMLRELVLKIYSTHCCGTADEEGQSATELLKYIAKRALEPKQERFKQDTFRARHDNREAMSVTESFYHPQKEGLFARIGKVFS
jgi:hypothetical protein